MNKQELVKSIMDQVVEGKYSKAKIERFLISIIELVSLSFSGNPLAARPKDNLVDLEEFRQARHGESDI